MRIEGALTWEDFERISLNKYDGCKTDDALTWEQFVYCRDKREEQTNEDI